MRFTPRHAALAALLAVTGFAAQAQPAPAAPMGAGSAPMHMHEGRDHPDGAYMQERMQRRMDSLKRILQITPAQEGAWSAWTGAMKPSAQAMQMMQQHHAMHEEFERMTTPERIDRMRQLHAQRAAEMDKRADATKTLYAQLTPSQQKAFDEVSLRFLAHHHGHHHGG